MDFKLTHFKVQEFVPRLIYETMGDNAIVLLKTILLITAEDIRSFFGKPVTINNWHSGGAFEFRGFRPAYYTEGAALSEHRLGGAFDCDIRDIPAEEARKAIIEHQGKFPYLRRMEDGVSWVHCDCRETGKISIVLFSQG